MVVYCFKEGLWGLGGYSFFSADREMTIRSGKLSNVEIARFDPARIEPQIFFIIFREQKFFPHEDLTNFLHPVCSPFPRSFDVSKLTCRNFMLLRISPEIQSQS
jgi:hypothetical protein